jgi:hypothetical protein
MSARQFHPAIVAELQDLSEKYKGELPAGFFEYTSYAEEQLAERRSPGRWEARGLGRDEGVKLAEAILQELTILLCGNDPKYRDVAKSGKRFAQTATAAVGGYIAAAFGIGIALATSAVAVCLLLVTRVGLGVFCRMSTDRQGADKTNQPL